MTQLEYEGKTFYRFDGRLKDNIDRGAEKINCEEVERYVRQHDAISDVAVVPYPCPTYGERGCACLIINDDQSAPDVKSLGAFLETLGVAKFKWPERIELFDSFPTTKSNKLSKPMLKEEVAKRVEAERAQENAA